MTTQLQLLGFAERREYDAMMERAREIAERRRRRHHQHPTKFEIDDEEAGIRGEIGFSDLLGLDPTPIVTSDGSGPVDFDLPGGLTCDVKTSWLTAFEKAKQKKTREGHLQVEYGHVKAALYVFAVVDIDPEGREVVEFKGWEFGREIRSYRPVRYGRLGMQSHRVPAAKLRPMLELARLLLDTRDRMARHSTDIEALRARQREVRRTQPVQTITDLMTGAAYTVQWSPSEQCFELRIDGRVIGVGYSFLNKGKVVWVDALDFKQKRRRSAAELITDALARHRSN